MASTVTNVLPVTANNPSKVASNPVSSKDNKENKVQAWIESQVAKGTLVPIELSENGNVQTTLLSVNAVAAEAETMEFQSASLKRG